MEKATPIYSPMDPHVMLDNEVCEDNPADRMLYLSIVGSPMFAALGTRPDIAFSVTALSRYNVQPLNASHCCQTSLAISGSYKVKGAVLSCH